MQIWQRNAEHYVEPWQDAAQAEDVGSLVHLRNAYIETMSLTTGSERCVPLLRGVSDALNFRLGRLYYFENLQETETLERSVEWIVRDLRVTEYELHLRDNLGDDDALVLLPTIFMHDSVRATTEYLVADVCSQSPASMVFERLFGLLFDAPKLDAVLRFGYRHGDGTEFAEGFIRKFVAADDVSRIAQGVSIYQRFSRNEPHVYLPKMCVTPRKQNVEAPKTRSLEQKIVGFRIEVQQCDLYVFQNDATGSELQLYAMAARAVDENDVRDLFIITLTTC